MALRSQIHQQEIVYVFQDDILSMQSRTCVMYAFAGH